MTDGCEETNRTITSQIFFGGEMQPGQVVVVVMMVTAMC
jgi:hypothetical protein